MTLPLDSRPLMVALAGPNGAGKSTFFEAHLQPAGLRFLNADDLARELGVGAYEAAELANELRRVLVQQRESFVFETVFSDPVGDKVSFLRDAARTGYTVVLCFIGLDSAEISEERVAMRVLQGGHDVPTEKLVARFDRTLENLHRAIRELPLVHVFDHSDRPAASLPQSGGIRERQGREYFQTGAEVVKAAFVNSAARRRIPGCAQSCP